VIRSAAASMRTAFQVKGKLSASSRVSNLAVAVLHDEARRQGRRLTRAAGSGEGYSLTKSPEFIDRPADESRTNERTAKHADPSASNHVESNDAEYSFSDPIVQVELMPRVVELYLAGADPRSPYASPLYGDPAGLPPIMIHVGSDEALRDDAVRMAEHLRAMGCQVELEVWPRMFHVWHVFARILPEARAAIARIGAFLQAKLS